VPGEAWSMQTTTRYPSPEPELLVPRGGDQKHGPDTIDLPTDAITHKHLFLKLFYIYIFCEYGNEDY